MPTVGVILNPIAGKDIRRLVTNASPVSDAAKVGMARRAVAGAAEGGADHVVLSDDPHRLGRRAIADLELPGTALGVLDEPVTGDRLDTVAAAARLAKDEVGAIVVFGGDGTHRDVVAGWADAPMVAVSTGTNNAFPSAWDATSAGTAAGLVASGRVDLDECSRRAKRISVHVRTARGQVDDVALVDVALVDGAFVGSRAVWDPSRIRTVVAAVAAPASSGLSSIAGRARPVDRWTGGGVVVQLGPGGRRLRLPIAPGSFATLDVASARDVAIGDPVELAGPGVITIDGERSHVLHAGDRATVTVHADGPHVIDVDDALRLAVERRCFDDPLTHPHDAPQEM
jgi:hypothetical protein